jgi:DeoR/GlpR family transcriptional regulator of sugar metabolism
MVEHLRSVAQLTIVTNALNVAAELHGAADARVLMLGGTMNYDTFGTLGPQVEQSLGELVVQKLFLAAESVDPAYGVTDSTMEIAQMKRAMVRAARQVYLLADSSKWQRVGFIKVIPFERIATVVTDRELPEVARRAAEQAGTEVLLV